EILAQRGYNVVLCDWDLEAPGLERYLLPTDSNQGNPKDELERLEGTLGLIDLLYEYKKQVTLPPDREPPSADHARLGNLWVRRPSSYAVRVTEFQQRSGSLRLLTSGRHDAANRSEYAKLVTRFDWEDFYARWAGGSYIEFLRQDLGGESASG